MGKWGELSPGTIHQIALEVREGTADPDDAKRMIQLFCECSNGNFPSGLVSHLQASLREYLSGGKTLEAALGLARKKGRPKADEGMRQMMAAAVLRHRLDGESHQDSLSAVAGEFGWGETIVGESWGSNKQNALILLRLGRSMDGYPWTQEEVNRLADIFRDELWFVAPGKSPIKPA